ncbi:MAG: HAD family phosphatase [Planctomycetota bacterium]
MTPSRAVIFDMDGVLIDSEPAHLDATNEILSREGAYLSAEQNRPYLGTNDVSYWKALSERFSLAGTLDHYIAERQVVLVRRLKETLPLAEGLIPFLDELKAQGVALAVASGSDRELVEFVVEEGGLSGYFPVIASGDEVTRPKPDPEIFLLAAQRLECDPQSCVVLEDSPNGARAALEAGMRCFRVLTATTQSLEFPKTAGEIATFCGLKADQVLIGHDADDLSSKRQEP